MTTSSQRLWLPHSVTGTTRPRLWTPPDSTQTEAVRVLRTAQRSGLLASPMPWQVYVHARLCELAEAQRRRWRKAGVVVGRGNGKTDGVLAPYILDSLEQGIGVLGLAQNLEVGMDTFTKVADTIEADPHLRKRIPARGVRRGKGQARVQLRHPESGRVATYRVSVTAKGCRGPRAQRLAVDESAYVDNAVMSAARYVQNGSGLPGLQQVLAVCTAGDDAEDANGDMQWFSRWRAAHLENLDPDLLWLEYSIPEDADPRDPRWWPLAVPALGYTITAQEIADNLDDPTFVQEALSRWGVTARRAIEAEAWARCLLSDTDQAALQEQRPKVGSLGVAVSPDEASAALVAGYRWNGRILVKVLDERPGTAWAVPVVKEWQDRARVRVQLDRRGPAGPLADDLEAAGVMLGDGDLDSYANGCAALLREVRLGTLGHFGQLALDTAVAGSRKRDVGERWVWARRAADIAALEAATHAAAGVRHARAGLRAG